MPPRNRSLAETIEHSLIRMLRPKRKPKDGESANGNHDVPQLTPEQRIKALAVAVRFEAVKKGLSSNEGSGFGE